MRDSFPSTRTHVHTTRLSKRSQFKRSEIKKKESYADTSLLVEMSSQNLPPRLQNKCRKRHERLHSAASETYVPHNMLGIPLIKVTVK